MKKVLLLFLLPCLAQVQATPHSYVSIGPMLHFNFGHTHNVSLGLEVSLWHYDKTLADYNTGENAQGSPFDNLPAGPGFGLDLGFEKEFSGGPDKIRVYAEPQFGAAGMVGAAAGPVLESCDGRTELGFQGSLWASIIFGGDLRVRVMKNETVIAPGTSLKISPGLFNNR